MDETTKSEQLEEGEIIDDDDFEDISDNSIIESAFGKFVSSHEHLRALPLTSDSEIDKQIRSKRKSLHHKSKVKLRKKRKRVRVPSESSESDNSPPDDLKGKLKEAIRIADCDEGHKNPLEKRLKAMGGLTTDPVTESAEPPKENGAESADKIDDAELENLRMEALKTAVLNKCQRRKRKKALLEAGDTETPRTLENKENNTPKEQAKDEKVNAEIDLEEDEDILRASLLAGLAKKIAKIQPPKEGLVEVKKALPQLPVAVVPALPKRPISKFKSNTLNKVVTKKVVINKVVRAKPQVKPLIINVNGDSDSDDESKPTEPPKLLPQKPPVNPAAKIMTDLNDITSNVEKFLKEQRAKFETAHKTKMETSAAQKTILEKSAVKLLPKSQQIEYQLLLKRLRNAEKRKKAKKLVLQKKPETKAKVEVQPGQTVIVETVTGETTPVPQVKVVVQPPTPVKSSEEESKSDHNQVKSSNASEMSEQHKARITSELTTLQRALKEIKTKRNGRFQIQSKYQILTPIIREITATSNERKKQEHRIKSLLQELNEARTNLSKSHERFSKLVKELVTKKEKIDKSCQELNTDKKINGAIVKDTNHKAIIDNKKLPVTSTPIKAPFSAADETTISTFVTSSTNNDYEDMDVCNSDETDVCHIDIVDPNDIDQIFKSKPPLKSAIPEYVSPLNFNAYERYENVDPLGIMCPYEVNGSCRDIDCTYKHYLKNHDRR